MCSSKSGPVLISLVSCLVVTLFLTYSHSVAAQEGSMKGFRVQEVKFDEFLGGKKPTPRIPKGWRFVGVTDGERANSNNLWFQDGSGNVYVIQILTSSGHFILDANVQKINAGK